MQSPRRSTGWSARWIGLIVPEAKETIEFLSFGSVPVLRVGSVLCCGVGKGSAIGSEIEGGGGG